ncbi:MAG: PIN domain-containing protein [Verrucomicrobiae bacterium]|nr:PIN domain-containing protein [Verrucomicrobiae bacterium]
MVARGLIVALTVVFDTNILFSATGWRGKPFECVELARAGKIQAVTCAELMDEWAEKLELKFGFTAEQSAETIARYLSFVRLVKIPGRLRRCRATRMTMR